MHPQNASLNISKGNGLQGTRKGNIRWLEQKYSIKGLRYQEELRNFDPSISVITLFSQFLGLPMTTVCIRVRDLLPGLGTLLPFISLSLYNIAVGFFFKFHLYKIRAKG